MSDIEEFDEFKEKTVKLLKTWDAQVERFLRGDILDNSDQNNAGDSMPAASDGELSIPPHQNLQARQNTDHVPVWVSTPAINEYANATGSPNATNYPEQNFAISAKSESLAQRQISQPSDRHLSAPPLLEWDNAAYEPRVNDLDDMLVGNPNTDRPEVHPQDRQTSRNDDIRTLEQVLAASLVSLRHRTAEVSQGGQSIHPWRVVDSVSQQQVDSKRRRSDGGSVASLAEMGLSYSVLATETKNNFAKTDLGAQLLTLAEAVATDDQRLYHFLTHALERKASWSGGYQERTVHYFKEALKLRLEGSGQSNSSRSLISSPDVVEKAISKLQKALPHWTILCKFVSSQMLAASQGSMAIHILDLSLWGGDYWTQLMTSLQQRPEGCPRVRFTKVLPRGDVLSGHVEETAYQAGRPILQAARQLGIPIEFNFIQQDVERITPASLCTRQDEVLLINASQYLYTLADETVLRPSPRDRALKALRKLRPKMLVLNEMCADFKGAFFLARVKDAVGFYCSMFECVDAALPRSSPERFVFEQLVGQDIVNVVACEGGQRLVRAETPSSWKTRMEAVAFVTLPCSPRLRLYLDAFTKSFSEHYSVVDQDGMLTMKWRTRDMALMSSWRTAC